MINSLKKLIVEGVDGHANKQFSFVEQLEKAESGSVGLSSASQSSWKKQNWFLNSFPGTDKLSAEPPSGLVVFIFQTVLHRSIQTKLFSL